MVTVPEASATQKLGVPHVLLTDSDVFAGMDVAVVYWTRMMSSAQTCNRTRPVVRVKVTPFASTVYGPVVDIGGQLVTLEDELKLLEEREELPLRGVLEDVVELAACDPGPVELAACDPVAVELAACDPGAVALPFCEPVAVELEAVVPEAGREPGAPPVPMRPPPAPSDPSHPRTATISRPMTAQPKKPNRMEASSRTVDRARVTLRRSLGEQRPRAFRPFMETMCPHP